MAKSDEAAPDPRDRILRAAHELFCAKGYHAVGTQEICERAGVLKGTLYHFFATKFDLAVAVLERFADAARDEFANAATGRSSPARRLVRVFELDRQMVARQKAESGNVLGCLFGNFVLELVASEPRLRPVVSRVTDEWCAAIEPPIRELMAEGTIPAGDPHDAAKTVLAALQGSVLMAKATNDPDHVLHVGRSVVRLLGGKDLAPLP